MPRITKDKLIGVLYGGISSEREISLRSGKNVADALESLGYKIKKIDIQRNCREQLAGIDVAYNILHGEFGEDGQIQQILEELKIPYTGSGPQASANCMNKIASKKLFTQYNLPTAEFEVPASGREITLTEPLVVKAANQGSSIGVEIVKTPGKAAEVFDKIQKKYGPTFVEKFINGAEVTVGVIEKDEEIIALPILELLPKGEFYDFTSKYTPGGTTFILPAALSPEVTTLTQNLAKEAYRLMRCAGAIRVDFVIENRQKPYILEINTIPGMTDQSDLPAEAKAMGIEFPQLVEIILQSARIGKY